LTIARHHPCWAVRVAAFTLIELLVVIAIIAVIISILLPALGSAVESGRQVQCAATLNQLVSAGMAHANDHRGAFSTGTWDNRRGRSEGPLDEKGWVADFLLGEYANPGTALCPGSPARTSQSLAPASRNRADAWKRFSDAEVEDLYNRGFNTNYCQSWQMAHTDMRFRSEGKRQLKQWSIGPLTLDRLGSYAPTSDVPLLGDGAAKLGDDVITVDGEVLSGVRTLTDGPVKGVAPDGTDVWARQDYEDFGTAHVRGTYTERQNTGHDRVIGQIAFADGNVKAFHDKVRDNRFRGKKRFHWSNGWIAMKYDELEGSVFGGRLNAKGPAW